MSVSCSRAETLVLSGFLTGVSSCRCQLQVLLRLEISTLSSSELDVDQTSEEVDSCSSDSGPV